MTENMQKYVESVLFASEQSVSVAELQSLLSAFMKEEITAEAIEECLQNIQLKFSADDSVFELVQISNGYQFLSKKEYHELLNLLIIHREKKKLSTAAMETLAIIAYKQPITKTEIEQIRGVNCDYSVQKLLEKDLIAISGRSSGPGKPILYETSQSFMDHFGLKHQKDLPQLKDIQSLDNTINPEDSTMPMSDGFTSDSVQELPEESDQVGLPESNENQGPASEETEA